SPSSMSSSSSAPSRSSGVLTANRPTSTVDGRFSRPTSRPPTSPHGAGDVALRAHEDVHDRAIVEVLREELGSDAALEERAAFLDFVGEDVEEAVVLDAFDD